MRVLPGVPRKFLLNFIKNSFSSSSEISPGDPRQCLQESLRNVHRRLKFFQNISVFFQELLQNSAEVPQELLQEKLGVFSGFSCSFTEISPRV